MREKERERGRERERERKRRGREREGERGGGETAPQLTYQYRDEEEVYGYPKERGGQIG